MEYSRRDFLRRSSIVAAGFFSLRRFCEQSAFARDVHISGPYGPLLDDPNGVLDLPAGFSYRVISVSGRPMSDGLFTPGLPDGMATFPGPDNLTIIIRNHELLPFQGPSAFGKFNELFGKVDISKVYDAGHGLTPHIGGTTTVVYDTHEQKVIREFLSLVGTTRNCSGGPTPWNSWITCEESVVKQGQGTDGDYRSERNHGYNFEVPVTAEIMLHKAVPLVDMGRFYHEAVAIDPKTGIVYQTEDRDDGLVYRFIPNQRGQLHRGGKLQALRFRAMKSMDTRNWKEQNIEIGTRHEVEWLDISNVDSLDDDLRYRGFDAGAARFARGEGMWYTDEQVFIACTNGGNKQTGQIWRLLLASAGSSKSDSIELFIEPNNASILKAADNMTVSAWGDIIVCEDHDHGARIMGVTYEGRIYQFAKNHLQTEFAGATFSPDGSTLFVNMQVRGMTVAITGPWHKRAAS